MRNAMVQRQEVVAMTELIETTLVVRKSPPALESPRVATTDPMQNIIARSALPSMTMDLAMLVISILLSTGVALSMFSLH
jgi:hypothetical protein